MPDDQNRDEHGYLKFDYESYGLRRESDRGPMSILKNCKENPFVPLGFTVVVSSIGYGVYSMIKGNMDRSMQMMRLRVGAQAFTVVALLVGAEYKMRKHKRERTHYYNEHEDVE